VPIVAHTWATSLKAKDMTYLQINAGVSILLH